MKVNKYITFNELQDLNEFLELLSDEYTTEVDQLNYQVTISNCPEEYMEHELDCGQSNAVLMWEGDYE